MQPNLANKSPVEGRVAIRPMLMWRVGSPAAVLLCLLGLLVGVPNRPLLGTVGVVALHVSALAWTSVIHVTGQTITRRRFWFTQVVTLNQLEYMDLDRGRNGWYMDLKDVRGNTISLWRNLWPSGAWEFLYARVMTWNPPRRSLRDRLGPPPVRTVVFRTAKWALFVSAASLVVALIEGEETARAIKVAGLYGALIAVTVALGGVVVLLVDKKTADQEHPRAWDERFFSRLKWWFK